MSNTLEFRFDNEKFVNALAFFASSGMPDLTKLKAAKLLFFTDKYHLVRFGTPVIGDRYYCLRFGPLPSSADNYMDEAETAARREVALDELFDRFLAVDARPQYPLFRSKSAPDLRVFSDSEREALQRTLESYGHFTAWDLVDLTHQELAFKISDSHRPVGGRADMPYELFFEGESGAACDVLELAQMEQEDRDIVAALRTNR